MAMKDGPFTPLEHGRYPDNVDTQVFEIVHLADNAWYIPEPIAVAIFEAGWVNLTAKFVVYLA